MVALLTPTPTTLPRASVAAVLVTPEQAQMWLSTTSYDRQRGLRISHVDGLAAFIRAGTFVATTITFAACAEDGRTYLVDGQHRLNAIVKSGIATLLYVADEPVDTLEDVAAIYGRLDRGNGRTMNDVLRAHDTAHELGLPSDYVGRIGSALMYILRDFAPGTANASAGIHRDGDVRVQALREWTNEAHLYWNCFGGKISSAWRRRLSAAPVASVALMTLRCQEAPAIAFWQTVAADDGLKKGSPERTLVDFINSAPVLKHGPNRMVRGVALCWNAAYEGRPLTLVKVVDDRAPIRILGTPYRGK